MPPPDRQIDSRDLSRRIASGCEVAFGEFYQAWYAPCLALARAAARRDESFCLDIVQDVMLTVAKRMPALPSEDAVGAWMTRTVRRAAIDHLRSEARRQRREQHAAARLADRAGPEPWRDLEAAEQHAWLHACLAELSPTDRALLTARFGGAGSVTAAAAGLGLGADAAHGRLRRVLERMRQFAAEWWHG